MGLAEKKAIETFKTSEFDKYKKQIDTAAGFPVEVNVEWNTLAEDDSASMLPESLPKVYFLPIINAFKEIGNDQVGKDALKTGVQKIVIKNEGGFFSPSGFSYNKGTLTIDHEPRSNTENVQERTDGIVELLNSKL